MYIEITSGNRLIGKTNVVSLRVYPHPTGNNEIISRDVYIAEIKELKKRIADDDSDFEAIKEALVFREADVSDDTPTSEYGNLVRNIEGVPSRLIRGILDTTIAEPFEVPEGTTKIKEYFFTNLPYITAVHIPDTVTAIETRAFTSCTRLETVNIPHGVKELSNYTFGYCYSLKNLYIPNTLTHLETAVFAACNSLENVVIEDGFNCNGLTLSSSSKYSAETIVSWLNALKDRTGLTEYTLNIGSYNLDKLTSKEIAIATNKNWKLV